MSPSARGQGERLSLALYRSIVMVFALLQAETTILNTILAMSSSRVASSDHARYITGQTLVVDGGATVVGSERRTQ